MQLSREFWVHKNKNIKQQFACKSVELIPDSGTKMLHAALECRAVTFILPTVMSIPDFCRSSH